MSQIYLDISEIYQVRMFSPHNWQLNYKLTPEHIISNVKFLMAQVDEMIRGNNWRDGLADLSVLLYSLYALRNNPHMVESFKSQDQSELMSLASRLIAIYRDCSAKPDRPSLSISTLLLLVLETSHVAYIDPEELDAIKTAAQSWFESQPDLPEQLLQMSLLSTLIHQELACSHFLSMIDDLSRLYQIPQLVQAADEMKIKFHPIYFPDKVKYNNSLVSRAQYVNMCFASRGTNEEDIKKVSTSIYSSVISESGNSYSLKPNTSISELCQAARDIWYLICVSGGMMPSAVTNNDMVIYRKKWNLEIPFGQIAVLLAAIQKMMRTQRVSVIGVDHLKWLEQIYREMTYWEDRVRTVRVRATCYESIIEASKETISRNIKDVFPQFRPAIYFDMEYAILYATLDIILLYQIFEMAKRTDLVPCPHPSSGEVSMSTSSQIVKIKCNAVDQVVRKLKYPKFLSAKVKENMRVLLGEGMVWNCDRCERIKRGILPFIFMLASISFFIYAVSTGLVRLHPS